MTAERILITGSVRSGKSRLAVSLAQSRQQPVVFLATAQALDEEMTHRIRQHQAERPVDWTTVEAPLAILPAIQSVPPGHTVVMDCLTLWITNLLLQDMSDPAIEDRVTQLAETVRVSTAGIIIVSNEVGWGLVPENALARRFRDHVGRAHQTLAQVCEEVYLVTCGLPLALKSQTKGN